MFGARAMSETTYELQVIKTLPIQKTVEDEDRLYIHGVAASDAVDETGDRISPEALRKALKQYMKFPTIRYMHRPEPVGRVTHALVDDGQLIIQGYIVDPDVIWKIKTGVLTALSVGGWINNYHIENGVRVIDDLRLVEISVVDVPANPSAVIMEYKGIVPRHNVSYGKDEEGGWDADAAEKRLRKWASSDGSGDKDKIDWGKYAEGFAWYDDSDPENFGSYKLPHHDVRDGKFVVVWRGVAAAMAALMGARGGVRIPESDRKKVYNHLAKHYREFGKEPPEYKSLTEILLERIEALEEKIALLDRIVENMRLIGEVATMNKDGEIEYVDEESPLEKGLRESLKERILRELVVDGEDTTADSGVEQDTNSSTSEIQFSDTTTFGDYISNDQETVDTEELEVGGGDEAPVEEEGEPIRRHHSEPMPLEDKPRIRGLFDLIKLKYGGENYE